jgi:hypothetical protein
VESGHHDLADPRPLGFDAAVEFQPRWLQLGPELHDSRARRWLSRLHLARRHFPPDEHVFSYERVVERMIALPQPGFLRFPGVTPSWDNSARRKSGAHILHGSTPALYRRWLEHAVGVAAQLPSGRRLVFVNAWNEWAEGNHLEPDERFGHGYLEATRDALHAAAGAGVAPSGARTAMPARARATGAA